MKDLGFLSEGEIAHYEASLTPVGDQNMVVEWFFNGNVIEASMLKKMLNIDVLYFLIYLFFFRSSNSYHICFWYGCS